ncbi:MAG: hypothetical protein HKN05_21695 [Rhizobiales bacterium]|nr:hypothetical protein [Hyphomicrobiales bacterium]
MFKKALLSLTALTAVTLLPLPYTGPADAAVKIKPATVKLKTKIRVAKPKVRVKTRVKVRTAKVRVKVHKKVRVKAAKVRVKKAKTKTKSAKLHLKPQVRGIANGKKKPIRIRTVRPALKVNPNLKQLVKKPRVKRLCWNRHRQSCRMAPANAVAKRVVPATAKAKLATFDKAKLERRSNSRNTGHGGLAPSGPDQSRNGARTTGAGYPSFKYPDPAFLADALRFSRLNQAAAAAQGLKALEDTLQVAGYSSGGLDMLFTPGKGSGPVPGETGDPFSKFTGFGDGTIFGGGLRVAGVGSSVFGFLDNSHSGDAPDTSRVGINVAGAIAGVAGDTTTQYEEGPIILTKTVHDDGSVTNTKNEVIHRQSDGGTIGYIETSETRSGGADANPTRAPDRVTEVEGYHDSYTRVTHYDGGFHPVEDMRDGRGRYRRVYEPNGSRPGRFAPGERRNPHHTGGSNCQNISCIIRPDKPKGLSFKEANLGKTQVLPPAPEDTVHTGQATAPLYSANDVLERYDPDSTSSSNGEPSNQRDWDPTIYD